jgi:hypothetical protein
MVVEISTQRLLAKPFFIPLYKSNTKKTKNWPIEPLYYNFVPLTVVVGYYIMIMIIKNEKAAP